MAAVDDPPKSGRGDFPPIQRSYCQLHRVDLPDRFPVQPRSELAIARPPIVATRDGEVLLCSGNHTGPHLWPDGDESGEWE